MNIAEKLMVQAQIAPHKIALTFPKKNKQGDFEYQKRTFSEVNSICDQFAHGLSTMGLKKGDKVLIFLRPSLDFSCLVFALFKMGVVPIFIDPGMGRKNLFKSIEQVSPDGLIAEKEVHLARLIFRKPFKKIKYFISNSNFTWGKMLSFKDLKMKSSASPFIMETFNGDETAAILFTSGGTGRPKGVVYTHSIFWHQTEMLQKMFGLTADDVDLPGFPLFGLFTVAMGMTSCFPAMNPAKPAQCDPAALVKNILDQKVTFIAGSPAIWEKVAKYCLKHNLTLPTVKHVVMFGAPVSLDIHEMFAKILPYGDTYTPYGATECLPVSNAKGSHILSEYKTLTPRPLATNIGQAVPGIQIKIIKITDAPIKELTDDLILKYGELGEIIVKGPIVTRQYYKMKDKTKLAKIIDKDDNIWHRMGDLGHLDEKNQLWFSGRKVHRVQTNKSLLYSVQVENIFNKHPEVARSALIGIEAKDETTAAIVIERKDKKILKGANKTNFEKELRDLIGQSSSEVDISKFYQSKSFPVDIRHNIKIDRKLLGLQACRGELQ